MVRWGCIPAPSEDMQHPARNTDELWRELLRTGQDRAPYECWERYRRDQIAIDDLRRVICRLWSATEFPCRTLPRWVWLDWFRATGFVSDCDRSAPTHPIEVWRAQVGYPIGLAWSTCRERAWGLYERNAHEFGHPARLLHGFVKPSTVLALVRDQGQVAVLADPRGRFWKVVGRNR